MNLWYVKSVSRIFRDSNYILHRLDKKTLKVNDSVLSKIRFILSKLFKEMSKTEEKNFSLLTPPDGVRGMTELNREAFTKSVKIPGLKVPRKEIASSQKTWKPLVLKLPALKPVAELSVKDPLRESHSLILLDPQKLTEGSLSTHQVEMLERLGLKMEEPEKYEVELAYENWSVADVMRAVLPCEVDNVTSFTQVGHIAHLNLKPETLPFKCLIGEVILDKVSSVKTVVNKLNTIDNTYRNFSMELLAGENNFVTQTKEHNCIFELDFSKVYWNSRLSTEHQRIVELIPKGAIVYDVFAGIGPFAIPLAKKKHCTVFANDLNPASYNSLLRNVKLNSIKQGHIHPSNLDGNEFILTVVKNNLEERLKQLLDAHKNIESVSSDALAKVDTVSLDQEASGALRKKEETDRSLALCPSYIIMNLPASAVEFLSSCCSLLHDTEFLQCVEQKPHLIRSLMPQVYCYAFSPKADVDSDLKRRVEESLGGSLPVDYSTRLVRNVAPNKEMVCISFKLWPELMLSSPKTSFDIRDKKRENSYDAKETTSKKQRLTTD